MSKYQNKLFFFVCLFFLFIFFIALLLPSRQLPAFFYPVIPSSTPLPTSTLTPTSTPKPTVTKKPTPKPSFTPTPITISPAVLEELFTKYANSQSVDREILRKIAVCESKLNPQATSGNYAGLYQFSRSSWLITRQRMNSDANPLLRFNPEETIKTAAFKIATDGTGAWPNCNK